MDLRIDGNIDPNTWLHGRNRIPINDKGTEWKFGIELLELKNCTNSFFKFNS